ncbi:helix-turn-helix domain-containing protein [Kitasatospora sp. NPDC086009]|uniref:helix-turn-helix domain-containing protein n=1 Tax=unclassified Kitasatospora TaxID=2633591 RepID=UPI0037C77DC5
MRIHRIARHTRGFTILDNGHVIRKHSLSWTARGLLAYLLSLPDASREDVRTLSAKSREGRTAIARALNELEAAGHYVRRTARDPLTGQVRTTVSVHEVPVTLGKSAHTARPLPASPAAGGPGAGGAGAGNAGSPSLTVKTVSRQEVEVPSIPPAEGLLTEDPELMEPADPEELTEAYAAFSALLGGTDGDSPTEPENEPQAPAQRATEPRQAAAPARMTEGMALLLELGQREPRKALAGKVLTDQAAMVEGLLAGGWTRATLMPILAAPLPEKIRRTVGAVISARLSQIPPIAPVSESKSAPVPRPVTYDCDNCRAPGMSRPGVCRKCREVKPTEALPGAVVGGGWRSRVPMRDAV